MCGIVGYVGNRAAVPILLQGLKTLEYRGYDSAGLAVIEDEVVKIIRSQGKIAVLEDLVGERLSEATCGIGHTRWATHGRPSDLNSHPHTDCRGEIAMVHNGIIENYLELKEFLSDKGHEFTSETDTEVLPHLVEHYYQDNLLAAVSRAIKDLRGSYATVAVCNKEPNKLVAARKDTPLIIGIGDDEYFFASDITALLEHTRKIIVMDDGEVACLTPEGYQIYRDMQPIKKEITTVTWDAESAKKGGYKHFMLKEIHEQPWALQQTLKGRIADDRSGVRLPEFSLDKIQLQRIEKVTIVACGTSYHAGLIGKYAMEKILRLPVEVDIASEFRYRDPLIDKKTLMLVISQSGETADTLAALREAKRRGAHVVAITNVLGSTISREAHDVIYTWAGPEIAVASTKAYTTQLAALYLLTMYLAEKLGRMKANELQALIEDFYRIPEKIDEIFASCEEQIKNIAEKNLKSDDAFFVGRSMDYAVALEGSLKLKEISYIHAEAYAAGELKHGTLALIVEGVPVLALCTQRALIEKTISNIKEIKARDAHIIGLCYEGMKEVPQVVDDTIFLPDTNDLFAPILAVTPLQLLAYYAACARGCDVDQPRNLAKSVTVE